MKTRELRRGALVKVVVMAPGTIVQCTRVGVNGAKSKRAQRGSYIRGWRGFAFWGFAGSASGFKERMFAP